MEPSTRRRREREQARDSRRWVLLAVLAIAALAAVWWFWDRLVPGGEAPEPEPVPVAVEPRPGTPAPPSDEAEATPAPKPTEAELFAPPDSNAADARVRELAAEASPNAQLAQWLERAHLASLFAVAVDQVADGRSPRRQFAFARPRGAFLVLGGVPDAEAEDEPSYRIDPAGYRRYDTIVGIVDSLDPEACARAYRALLPVFQAAYEELGYPDQSFDARFRAAAEEILATPEIESEPALRAHVKRYEFADEHLESLPDVQKQLLRMGPKHVRTVQAKTRAVLQALNEPE